MTGECAKCGPQPVENFHKNKSRPNGMQSYCKSCTLEFNREHRRGKGFYREYQRVYFLKWKYGLTPEQWDAMLVAQCGRCACCSDPMIGDREPVVDHNHETGCVRGLLCNTCNRAIGLLKDDPVLIRQAAVYLELS